MSQYVKQEGSKESISLSIITVVSSQFVLMHNRAAETRIIQVEINKACTITRVPLIYKAKLVPFTT